MELTATKVINNDLILDEQIFKNTGVSYWDELLKEKGLIQSFNEFGKSRAKRLNFLQIKFKENIFAIDDINHVLEKELPYGNQRNLEIYDFYFENGFNRRKNLSEILNLENMCKKNVLFEVSNNVNVGEFKLGYFKILSATDEVVIKIRLIFVAKIEVKLKGVKRIENSYFPIEFDFNERKIIIKYCEKNGIVTDYKGETFTNKIINEISKWDGLILKNTKQTQNQKALYSICNELLNDLINKVSKKSIDNLDIAAKNIASVLKEGLKCDLDSLYTKHKDNTFEVEGQIKALLENIALTKFFYEMEDTDIPHHAKGKINYIHYKEKNLKATVRKDRKIQNLIDSKTYLSIRKILEDENVIEELGLIFNRGIKEKEYSPISLRYNASKYSYLGIKFFKNYGEEEVVYALQQIKSYE